MASNGTKVWEPLRYFDAAISDARAYAVVVLDVPIRNYAVFSQILDRAKIVIAADGAGNRLKKFYEDRSIVEKTSRLPDAIVGDLDSLWSESRVYFEDKGTTIYRIPDQVSTDFGKCLRYIYESWSRSSNSSSTLDTIAFGGLGGRADHAFGQVHQLYKASYDAELAGGDIYLYTNESIMFVLQKGKNTLHTPVGPDKLGENVGIIPLAGPAVISLEGFEYDVTDWETNMGTQLSTSNHIRRDQVTVWTDQKVLFTMELARKPDSDDL